MKKHFHLLFSHPFSSFPPVQYFRYSSFFFSLALERERRKIVCHTQHAISTNQQHKMSKCTVFHSIKNTTFYYDAPFNKKKVNGFVFGHCCPPESDLLFGQCTIASILTRQLMLLEGAQMGGGVEAPFPTYFNIFFQQGLSSVFFPSLFPGKKN